MEPTENGFSQANDAATASVASASVTGETPVAEKTFTQNDVDKIVGRVRAETRQEAQIRAKQELESQRQLNSTAPSSKESESISHEKIKELVDDQLQERVIQAERHRTVNDFVNKIKSAEGKHAGLEEKVMKLNLAAAPHLIDWANSHDNTAEIMNEFANSPNKYAEIIMLSSIAPDAAREMMDRLSKSIKQNEEALKQPSVDEPLSQIKPSSSVGTDNGEMTVRDYKRQSWARG